jgi:hypothetical protein
MTKLGKIVVFCIIVVAVAVIVLFLLFNTYKNKEKELRKLSITSELITRFESIDSGTDTHASNYGFRWNGNDGYSVFVPSTEAFFLVKPRTGCFERDLVPDLFEKELSIAKRVFTERGFVLDKTNSSTSTSDRSFYDYVQAYKKDDELCKVVANPDCSSYEGSNGQVEHQLRVSCGNTFAKARAEQLPFLEALELKDKNGIVKIRNQNEAFFEIGLGWLRTGSTAILKKEDDTYRVLFIGQESPSCNLIDEEKIPSEVLSSIGKGGCFVDDGEYREFVK